MILSLWAGLTLPLSANAGTPLMWAGMLHLLFGNALLALLEAGLLWAVFQRRFPTAFFLMLAANYVSALAGVGLVGEIERWSPPRLPDLATWMAAMIGVCYLATLAVEWPFVWATWRFARASWRRGLAATLVVQTLSYASLCLYYLSASRIQLLRDFTVVEASALPPPAGAGVAFRREAGAPWQIMQLPTGAITAWEPPATWENNRQLYYTVSSGPWVAQDLGGWGAVEMHDENTGQAFTLGWETPLLRWPASHIQPLADNYWVFQLGPDQICALDPNTRQIALLAQGCEPVVVPAKPAQP